MNKAEKVAYIMDELQRLYPKPPVPLDHTDPYTLLIAVLLSAQCTDERVNQVTPELFDLALTPRTANSSSTTSEKLHALTIAGYGINHNPKRCCNFDILRHQCGPKQAQQRSQFHRAGPDGAG